MDSCPHCGEDIEDDARHCPHCGSDEETGWDPEGDVYGDLPDLDEPEADEARPVGGRLGGALVLVAAILVLVGAGAIWAGTRMLVPAIVILACVALFRLVVPSRRS